MSTKDSGEKHFYDGIEEHDNALPRWWLLTFYGTVVFAIAYMGYYFVGQGVGLQDEWRSDQTMIEVEAAKAAAAGGSGVSEDLLAKALKSPESLAQGKAVFIGKCASCHGAEGQGGIGPNLVDRYWIHGGKPLEITKTVQKGVLDKGMPPWEAVLSADELVSVVAFVRSIQGTTPAGAKAPQGTLVQE